MPGILSGRTLFVAVVALLSSTGFLQFAYNLFIPPQLPASYFSLDAFASKTLQYRSMLVTTPHNSRSPPLDSCEDATEWASQEKVLLSCDPNRINFNTVMGPLRDPSPRGHLWVIDPAESTPTPRLVEILAFPESSNFHPLGIDVLPGENGMDDFLFVVNHQATLNTVEIFFLDIDLDGDSTATYLQTVSHPSFTGAPNSILPISLTSFYLTHDHQFNRRSGTLLGAALNFVETVFALPLGRVDFVTFNGEATLVATVAKGIGFANGIAISHDGSEVAIASSTHRKVYFYERDSAKNTLNLKDSVSLPFSVDNLSTAPLQGGQEGQNSTFIAAGHPYYFSLLARSRGKEDLFGSHPMSWVVAIKPRVDDSFDEQAKYPVSKRSKKSATRDVVTLFQSKGGPDPDAFGMSTTGVAGLKDGVPWLVISGLYSEGVKIIRGIK